MVYIALALGFIVGGYALTRFFLKANPNQIKDLLFILVLIAYVFVLLFFALTGRILIAIVLLIPAVFFLAKTFIQKKKNKLPPPDDEN